MTQPRATRMLHEIETTFGARPFEHSKRGVQANDPGYTPRLSVLPVVEACKKKVDQIRVITTYY